MNDSAFPSIEKSSRQASHVYVISQIDTDVIIRRHSHITAARFTDIKTAVLHMTVLLTTATIDNSVAYLGSMFI